MTTFIDFPTVPVSKQLFHVPGAAVEGGYTSGSVRIMSPEPGGRSVLELQIALQVQEWDYPVSSWLMSKGNGTIFRVRLAPTPQVLGARSPSVLWEPGTLWTGDVPWAGDITASYAAAALEGATSVIVNMAGRGDIVRRGHVIGHLNNCYMVDAVSYDTVTDQATLTITPPLRNAVAIDDIAPFRPYFLGTISNMDNVRNTYDAENVGLIQIGKITFTEAII